jgi:hypothetical protein
MCCRKTKKRSLVLKLRYEKRIVTANQKIEITLNLLRLTLLDMLISRTFVICSGTTNVADYKIYKTTYREPLKK